MLEGKIPGCRFRYLSRIDLSARNMKTNHWALVTAVALVGGPGVSTAQIETEDCQLQVETGTTLMASGGSGDAIADKGGMGFDLFTTLTAGRGAWGMLLEAETHSMADRLSRKNSSYQSHEAIRSGDAALAELHYTFPALGGQWSVGLLDSKVHIDGSEVANDDKEQFLGEAFVNNPAIAIPENDLGLAYKREPLTHVPGITLLAMKSELTTASSSHPVRGVFLAAEAFKPVGPFLARFGAWTRSSTVAIRNGNHWEGTDYGYYVSVDGLASRFSWNLRVGKAEMASSVKASYFGAALRIPLRQSELGIGVGRSVRNATALSGQKGSSNYLELFYRFTAFRRVIITPDIQYERISGVHGKENLLTARVRFRVVS